MNFYREGIGRPEKFTTLGNATAWAAWDSVQCMNNRLMGKFLTIVESVAHDKEQRESMKSVVRDIFFSESNQMREDLCAMIEIELDIALGHRGGLLFGEKNGTKLNFTIPDCEYDYFKRKGTLSPEAFDEVQQMVEESEEELVVETKVETAGEVIKRHRKDSLNS